MARGSTRISGITIELNGDVTGLNDALKSVDSQLRKTQSSLKDIDKLLKFDPKNTELLTQKQKDLQSAIDSTKERLKKLKSAQSDALTPDQKASLKREIIATEQELKSLEKKFKSFGSVSKQKIEAVGKKMQAVGKKMQTFGKNLTTYVSLPLVAIGTAGVNAFAEVDKTMQLTNQTMGNTEAEAKLLSDAMKDAAANSTFGMSDAAEATLNFARAGLDASEAAEALAPAMNLAAGEGGNLDTVSAGLVATINGFQDSFENTAKYADVFAAACNNSALDIDSLSSAMSVAAPIFAAAGYSVNDAALYMGIMANNGIEADKAANSLKTGMARLVSPAKEGAEMMEKLGISVTNADGSMKDSVQIQQELHDAFSQLSESEQLAAASAIFGKNQMAPWLALINTAPEDVNTLNDSLDNCAGTTDEMAEAMMSGFGGSIEKLKSSIDVLVTSLGESLAPIIQKVIDFVQTWVDKFNSLDDDTKSLIATIALVVAAIGPVILAVGTVTSAVGSLTSAFSGVISILTGPAGIVIAIGAIIAAGVYLVQHWDEVKEKVTELWEKIKGAFNDGVEKLKSIDWVGLGKAIWEWITEKLATIATWFKEKFNDAVTLVKEIDWTGLGKSIWDWIKEAFENIATWFKTQFITVVTKIKEIDWKGLGTQIWDWIKSAFSAIGAWFKEKFDAVVEKIKEIDWKGLGEDIWDWLVGAFTDAAEWFEGIFQDALDLIADIDWEGLGEDIWDWIVGAFTDVAEWFEGIFQDALDLVADIDWSGLGEDILGWITDGLADIGEWFDDVFQGALDLVEDIDWTGLGEDLWSSIQYGITGFWDNIGTFFSTQFETAKNNILSIDWAGVGSSIWTLMSNALSNLGAWFADLFKEPINAVIRMINTMIGSMENAINYIVDGINAHLSVSVPNWVPFVGGKTWSPGLANVSWGRLRELANGGILGNGQHAIVGEYAPEYLRVVNGRAVVTPIQGADRFTNNNTNTFNIYAQPGMDAVAIANEVQRIMTRQQRQRSAAYA